MSKPAMEAKKARRRPFSDPQRITVLVNELSDMVEAPPGGIAITELD